MMRFPCVFPRMEAILVLSCPSSAVCSCLPGVAGPEQVMSLEYIRVDRLRPLREDKLVLDDLNHLQMLWA